MTLRTQQLAVLAFWLASMTWLMATKLVPTAPLSQLPDHRLVGPGTDSLPSRATWQIECDGKAVGMATTAMVRPSDGTPTVKSDVQLKDFPLGKVLGPLIDTWGQLTGMPGLTTEELKLTVGVRTRMTFSQFGELQHFTTEVDLDYVKNVLHIRGTRIKDDRLQVIVSTMRQPSGGRGRSDPFYHELLRQDFRVPPGALIIDGFIPHPRLARLQIGQEWLMQAFRPFSPTQTLRQIRCQVLKRELMAWEREMELMYVVAMTDASPGGLTATQATSALLWVRHDGTVVRQQMQLGGTQIVFQRVADNRVPEAPHDSF